MPATTARPVLRAPRRCVMTVPRSTSVRVKSGMSKTSPGNFFEDFRVSQVIRHATPRTVTTGDVALYNGLFGPRFAVQSSDVFAKAIGYPRAPIDDLLVFHIVFGKTVPDVSLNAVANLGYAGCCFRQPVYPGDTITALSEVIGLKENSSRKTGIVYVRTTGENQDGNSVLEYVRWVMVRKRDENAPAPGDHMPRLPTVLDPKVLGEACPPIECRRLRYRALRQLPSLRRLRSRRKDRPCRRHHRRGGRTHDRRPGSIRTPRASISTCSPRGKLAALAAG